MAEAPHNNHVIRTTNSTWEFLPPELGYGSGSTCRRRLRDWHQAGVCQALHELLAELRAAGRLDFPRAAVDGSHLRAMKGGAKTGPSPVDRGRSGSKHNVIVEAHGITLAATLTGGSRHEVTHLITLVQAVPPLRGKRRRPRRRPTAVYANRGYDLRLLPPRTARPGHPTGHRSPRDRARLRPGRPPLGRRSRLRAPALVPPSAHPLGDPRRPPRSLPQPQRRHHLLAPPEDLRLLGVRRRFLQAGSLVLQRCHHRLCLSGRVRPGHGDGRAAGPVGVGDGHRSYACRQGR